MYLVIIIFFGIPSLLFFGHFMNKEVKRRTSLISGEHRKSENFQETRAKAGLCVGTHA
jgi:hypothetical protein